MSQQTLTLIPFSSTRCVLRGGSWNGLEIYIPRGNPSATIPGGEVYLFSGVRDGAGRLIYEVRR